MSWTLAIGNSVPGMGQIIDIKSPVPEDENKKLVLIALSGRPEGHAQFSIVEWKLPSEEPGWIVCVETTLEEIMLRWRGV